MMQTTMIPMQRPLPGRRAAPSVDRVGVGRLPGRSQKRDGGGRMLIIAITVLTAAASVLPHGLLLRSIGTGPRNLLGSLLTTDGGRDLGTINLASSLYLEYRPSSNRTRESAPFDAGAERVDAAAPRVFIGVKTGEGPSGLRLSQARKSWLRDALVEARRGRIDMRFFTAIPVDPLAGVPPASSLEDQPSSAESAGTVGIGGSSREDDSALFRRLFVTTNCTMKKDLLCGTSALFRYYLEHHGSGTYFCSFDDDQYVIVHNLIHVLDEYDNNETLRGSVYVGRKSIKDGIRFPSIAQPVQFLTGGAGYCLSHELVERGRHLLTALDDIWRRDLRVGNYADDCAVGYVVTQRLGAGIIEDGRFHSHLDIAIRGRMPLQEVSRQVSFGYNTKIINADKESHRRMANATIPNVPVRFPYTEDPMLFRSLRCFLNKEDTGWDTEECIQ